MKYGVEVVSAKTAMRSGGGGAREFDFVSEVC